jgi:hypothetical protein
MGKTKTGIINQILKDQHEKNRLFYLYEAKFIPHKGYYAFAYVRDNNGTFLGKTFEDAKVNAENIYI